jgi:hypothetical protein
VLCERDLHRGVAELHGLAALRHDDLLVGHTELLCDFGGQRRSHRGCTGLLRDRADVGDVIEVGVGDEDRFRLLDVLRLEADVVRPRRAVEIGVEQIDLALVGEFEIGIAEPADHDDVGADRRRRPAGHRRLSAVAGIGNIGREGRPGQRETDAEKSRGQRYRFHENPPVRIFSNSMSLSRLRDKHPVEASGPALEQMCICSYFGLHIRVMRPEYR